MKIAIIGYGKMGKAIEKIAVDRGHEIVAKFNSENVLNTEKLNNIDVAIEITRPELAEKHINICLEANCPIVIGTTGWYDHFEAVKLAVDKNTGALLYATNFSIGVNLFFEVNRKMAALMAKHNDTYKVLLTEIHHTEKLDAPSGTAISIANQILEENKQLKDWALVDKGNENTSSNETPILPIIAERLPNVPGTHVVKYDSEVDFLELSHTAKNRTGFALGAVMAAEFLKDKKGIYTMKDVLDV